jgi:hypothetical protein
VRAIFESIPTWSSNDISAYSPLYNFTAVIGREAVERGTAERFTIHYNDPNCKYSMLAVNTAPTDSEFLSAFLSLEN